MIQAIEACPWGLSAAMQVDGRIWSATQGSWIAQPNRRLSLKLRGGCPSRRQRSRAQDRRGALRPCFRISAALQEPRG